MRVLLSTLVSMALAGSVLTAVVILLAHWTRSRFSARWYRAVLCVPLAFFALPVGLAVRSVISAFTQGMPGGEPLLAVFPEPLQGLQFEQLPTPVASWQPVYARVPDMLLLVWLTGVLLALTYRILQLYRFRRMLRKSCTPVEDAEVLAAWNAACRNMHVRRPPVLLTNPCTGTPMLTAWRRGTAMILPGVPLSGRELVLVFRHELIHARRRDLWLKWAAMLLGCLHWFNPLVYLLGRRLSHWIELACDEEVVRELDTAQRREYGLAILAAVEQPRADDYGICTALSENKAHMKERLSAMLNKKQLSKRTNFIAVLVMAAVAACGFLVGCAGQSETVERNSQPAPEEQQDSESGQLPEDILDVEAASEAADAPLENPFEDLDLSTNDSEGPTQLLWPLLASHGYATTYEGHTGMGVDITGREDSEIIAAADAVVVDVVRGYTGYGHYAILDHGGGIQTLYAHCASIDVEVGDVVSAGEPIAVIGRSGWATGVHLHFEVRRNGQYVDPREYIGRYNTAFPEL